ncbi:MAG: phosphodiester glycosidase family protein [Clostridiales Family XIII bacterium]|jgi:exopolysaccharide biosynthesis protein|nr:phosphodiester glycosidase family protein [Clostridiales Family XIII bacterium]
MRAFFAKPFRWAILYAVLLTGAFVFVLLDTFVVPKAYATVSEEQGAGAAEESAAETEDGEEAIAAVSEPVITDTSYEDENIKITITTTREYDTTVHIADIQIKDVRYLKTAFAAGTFGRNITETTSDMAEDHGAIFAINGDYCGFRDSGYVLRNGVLYRSTGTDTALVLDGDGNMYCAAESALEDTDSLWQIWSFGPVLVEGSEIQVDVNTEISGRSMSSNPRTAIGQIEPLHYVFIVSDGRTNDNEGLSLYQLASVFQDYGCEVAYNLDGGGSSTMWFNGTLVNAPTTNGRRVSEREVGDIVYIGY